MLILTSVMEKKKKSRVGGQSLPFLWVALSNTKERTKELFQQLNPNNGGVFVRISAVVFASMVPEPLEGFLRNLCYFRLCVSSYLWSARTIQRRVLDYVYNVRLLSGLHFGGDVSYVGVMNIFSLNADSIISPWDNQMEVDETGEGSTENHAAPVRQDKRCEILPQVVY